MEQNLVTLHFLFSLFLARVSQDRFCTCPKRTVFWIPGKSPIQHLSAIRAETVCLKPKKNSRLLIQKNKTLLEAPTPFQETTPSWVRD